MKTNIKNIMFNMTAAALFASTVGCLSFSEKTSSNSDNFASGNTLTLPLAETEVNPEDELSECESEILKIKERMASGKMVEGEVLGTLYSLHSLMARKDFLEKNIASADTSAGE
ncbi:MAG: hypothetical protein H6680_01090 [Desulfobacteraceae bacterium]|nr:hypothetical protein [Desulfobacteraceae bacterium]